MKSIKNKILHKISAGLLALCLVVSGAGIKADSTKAAERESGFEIGVTESKGAARIGVKRTGIDVSRWQGSIDWKSVKDSGVEFAIIKLGGRYENPQDGTLYEDPYFRQNIKGATAAGIKVGVYFYTQAVNATEAVEEAEYVLSLIPAYRISLPIFVDYEWRSNEARLAKANLSKAQATENIRAFCAKIASTGYQAGVYGSDFWINSYFDAKALSSKYRIWAANYEQTPDKYYSGPYDIWQYTSDGQVPGINARVDMNYWYDDGQTEVLDYSMVFDPEYYADRNPDLKAAYGYDAAKLFEHFVAFGAKEGRKAHIDFNVKYYKERYPDLRKAFGNDTLKYIRHYMKHGFAEGRDGKTPIEASNSHLVVYQNVDYSFVYDYNFYTERYPDLKKVYGNDDKKVLEHFVKHGIKEGRRACRTFDVNIYKNLYSDLQKAFGSDNTKYVLHYLKNGIREGREGI